MKIVSPYDDFELVYDLHKHQYVLTLSFAKQLVGNAYLDDGVMERRLKKNSDVVYNYIYAMGNTSNKEITKYIINCTEEGRELIKQALASQIEADAENGYNDLGKQNPIDFTSGNVIDREEIRRNIVCIDCQNILENSGGDLEGYNLLCSFPYNKNELLKLFEGVVC